MDKHLLPCRTDYSILLFYFSLFLLAMKIVFAVKQGLEIATILVAYAPEM